MFTFAFLRMLCCLHEHRRTIELMTLGARGLRDDYLTALRAEPATVPEAARKP